MSAPQVVSPCMTIALKPLIKIHGAVAELAYAADLKSADCKVLWVRVPLALLERNRMKEPYPDWICNDCAKKLKAKKVIKVSTFHTGKCGFCGEEKGVTEPRDWGYPGYKKYKT